MVSTVLPQDMIAGDWGSAPLVTRRGERVVVWLDGEHDISTVAALEQVLAKVAAADDADVIVDLSGVTFMSTATLEALTHRRNLLLHRSRTLTLRSPSKCVQRLLDLSGLAGLVEDEADGFRPR